MGDIRVLIDIGSTFTKAVAVDLAQETVICTARTPTTAKNDVTIGVRETLKRIEVSTGPLTPDCEIVACSSAAGGLRMVAIGLMPELSSEAAKRAALGAGAKIVGHFCHHITRKELEQIEHISPDIILLAGGTDGGNDTAIVHNASMLSQSKVKAPVVVAGNKCAYDTIEDLLKDASKTAVFVENVMPEIGKLEVEACREAIRAIFMENIIKAKGLDTARELIGDIIMPTPAAVLRAATLLADGVDGEDGIGELIVIDVGGATTDVYSIARGNPSSSMVLLRGLPEPYAKRTVEGDLGVRHNIDVLRELCVRKGIVIDEHIFSAFHAEPSRIPASEQEFALDQALSRAAVETSFERHTGKVEVMYGPHGEMAVQTGKDLTTVNKVIGTGGPLVCSLNPRELLDSVVGGPAKSNMLKPKAADFFIDKDYVMFAMGLLARSEPKKALRILKKTLSPV
ncbi:MAG TPA: methylaspartate mutase accessory protein GlmL [Syntrophorhabdaceae bacterium]|nr:methylaspartate mutase accessory protein GlmL [Syntrophorhabdaceae bacterium]